MTLIRFQRVGATLVLAVLMGLVAAQHHVRAALVPQVDSQIDQSLLAGIKAGDPLAISQAGRSGNRAYVPVLTPWVQGRPYPGFTDRSPTEQARLALAKLGARDQLQEYWCAVVNDAATELALSPPIATFQFIGGWYSIRALTYFFEPNSDAHWIRAGERMTAQRRLLDVQHPAPIVLALRALPKAVPNPPLRESEAGIDNEAKWREEAAIWQKWIADNESDLRRLEPTGEGVDLTPEACKDGRPLKRP